MRACVCVCVCVCVCALHNLPPSLPPSLSLSLSLSLPLLPLPLPLSPDDKNDGSVKGRRISDVNHLTDCLSSQRKPLTEELTVQRSFSVTPADLKRAVDPVFYRVIVNLVRCDVILNIRESNFAMNVWCSTLHSLAM